MVDASAQSSPSKYEIEGVVEPGSEVADLPGVQQDKPRSTAYWIGVLVVLLLLSEEVAYAFNLVIPALPNMALQLQTPSIAWVSTIFTLSGAVTAPLIGKLADRQGKKKWLVIVALCMAVGSAIVALAPNFEIVLIGRAIEGLGIAIVPITYSLMRDIFPKRMMAMAVSVATAGIGVTGILGPIFAGVLIDNFGYHGVFWALAIFPAIVTVVLIFVVPESPIRVKSRIDWIGGVLLGAALAVLLYALGEGATWGWASGQTLSYFAGALILLVAFYAWERRTSNPLIDVRVLASRGVVTTAVAQFTAQAIIVIQFILLAYIVQTPSSVGITYGLGESAGFMSVLTTPAGIVSVAMGFFVGWLAERRGARLPGLVAFVAMGLGSVILAFSHSSFVPILIGFMVYAFGGGMVSAAIPNLVIAATPVHLQAVTANTIGVVGSLGSAVAVQVGFALLGANVLTLIEGTPIYAGSGFTTVYLLAAAFAVIGLLATVVMRHGRRPQSVEAHI
jgi:MFS family permease